MIIRKHTSAGWNGSWRQRADEPEGRRLGEALPPARASDTPCVVLRVRPIARDLVGHTEHPFGRVPRQFRPLARLRSRMQRLLRQKPLRRRTWEVLHPLPERGTRKGAGH